MGLIPTAFTKILYGRISWRTPIVRLEHRRARASAQSKRRFFFSALHVSVDEAQCSQQILPYVVHKFSLHVVREKAVK